MTLLDENPTTTAPAPAVLPTWARETVRTYGSAVELVAGAASTGSFALALHHQVVTAVEVRARSAKESAVRATSDLVATSAALEAALEHFGHPLEVQVRRLRSSIMSNRHLSSREADAAAAVLALAAVLETPLSTTAASLLVHSSTGALMGLSASAHTSAALLVADTGAPLRLLPSLPRLALALAVPATKDLAPRDALVPNAGHDDLLASTLSVLDSDPDVSALGALATRSALLSAETAPHAHLESLLEVASRHRSGLPDALGVAVGARSHNGAVLFDASPAGRQAATRAAHELRELVGEGWFSASTTHAPLD